MSKGFSLAFDLFAYLTAERLDVVGRFTWTELNPVNQTSVLHRIRELDPCQPFKRRLFMASWESLLELRSNLQKRMMTMPFWRMRPYLFGVLDGLFSFDRYDFSLPDDIKRNRN